MTQPDVLVIDDEFSEGSFFREAFGDAVRVCRSIAELAAALQQQQQWSAAFVDFYLGPEQPSGLSASALLRRDSPHTPLISYTHMGESGRTLYVAAARRWFNSDAVLTKSHAHPDNLHH